MKGDIKMSQEKFELKKSVNVGYPGKYDSHPGNHGKFLCDKDDKGEYIAEKDTYDLKEFFTPSERETFYGHVKGILQGLEVKYPPSKTVQYKEAETLVNEKTGNSYQKVKENGMTLTEAFFEKLTDEEKKGYKRIEIPEMQYSITGNHYEKDGKNYDSFQLTITSNKHEAIRVNYNKNCEATYIGYNKDNSFVNGKPSGENKWVNLDQKTAFASEVLRNFATDLSATVVRSERTGRSLPTIYSEVNQYIKDHSPKTTNADGKEVAEYYSTGFHFAGSVMKDKDGNALKDDNGADRKYQRDCFSFMNHKSESITFNLQDGDISGIYYKNLETKDSMFNSDVDALSKISEACTDKAFAELLNEALVNYSKNADKVNSEIVNDSKDGEFAEIDEIAKEDMPF